MIQAAPNRATMKEELDDVHTTTVVDASWCELDDGATAGVNDNIYLSEACGTADTPGLGVNPTTAAEGKSECATKGYGLIQKGGGGKGDDGDDVGKGGDYGDRYGGYRDYGDYGGKGGDYGGDVSYGKAKGGGGKSYLEQGRLQAAGSGRSTKRRGGAGEKIKRAQIAGSDECIAAMASLFRNGYMTCEENEILLRAYGSTALDGFVQAARAQVGGGASSSSGK